MFDELSAKLESVLKRIRGQARISEDNVADSLREVRRALLDADVNVGVVKDFIARVQRRAIGQEVLRSLSPGQLIVKIISDELITLMGSESIELPSAPTPPSVYMVAGLQGSGKTTFVAKLARMLKARGKSPVVVAADIHRPAAVEQLRQLSASINVPTVHELGKDAVSQAEAGLRYARENARDVVIVDTAGRTTVDEEMMAEAEAIKAAIKPHWTFLVLDSMTGQDAVTTAKAFHDRLDFDGVVLTKLDGDTRGGAALSIRSVVQKPIVFVSVGEKLDQLETFHPDRMASRILGMGDVVTLVEKTQEQYDDDQAAALEQKLLKNQFTLIDFLEQLQQIKKMGSLRDLLGMIPGVSNAMRNMTIDERALGRIEAIIRSMTPGERTNPRLLNGSRRRRIALGSGTTVQDVNRLMKQFDDMQRMMKNMGSNKMRHVGRMMGIGR